MIDTSKTSLTFEAPADLSVGHVVIQNEHGPVADWVATASSKTFRSPALAPGIYTAEIAPPGTRPQIFVFEVMANTANTVSAPLFSTLAAGGNDAAFSGVPNLELAFESLHRGREQASPAHAGAHELPVQVTPLGKGPPAAAARKQIMVGISREQAPLTESWRPFESDVSVEVAGAGVAFRVVEDPLFAPGKDHRVRLSIALEKMRVERLLLPLYRGGTFVSVTPSPLSTSDIELAVTPIDPQLRALYRALDAGTPEIAAAVRSEILGDDGVARYLATDDGEPWGAMLAALLAIRFPDIFAGVLEAHADAIHERLNWSYDAHVIYAKHILTNVSPDPETRRSAARAAIAALKAAQQCGSPYFAYTNQVAGELLGGLASLQGLDLKLARAALNLLARWQRNLPLQRGAGASFSWTRRDRALLQKNIMRPYSGTTGTLDRRHSRIVLRGHVGLGQIAMNMAVDAAPKEVAGKAVSSATKAGPRPDDTQFRSTEEPPALARAVQVPDDPNKGRFGGKASRGGYTLSACFARGRSRNWVRVTLTVRADERHPRSYSDLVSFCLHPTFDPQWVHAAFRGREASITVKAWGGFTVGAWLPEQKIELECDLALLPDAPTIVREL